MGRRRIIPRLIHRLVGSPAGTSRFFRGVSLQEPPTNKPLERWWPFFLAVVLLAVSLLYGSGFDLKLYADDYIAWSKILDTMDQPWWRLFGINYNPEFYRPFEHLLIRLNVHACGTNPVLYRAATILGHLLMVVAVCWLAWRFRFGRAEVIAAGLVFGFSHANAMAAFSNDAACQIYTTLFGTLALGNLLRMRADQAVSTRQAAISALWLLGSLLWKDAGISYVPALACLLAVEVWRLPRSDRGAQLLRLLWPFLLVLLFYFALRWQADVSGPNIGREGRYDLWFGLNIPMNIGLFLLGMLSPVGSSILVLRMKDPFFLTVWAVSMLVTIGLLGLAYWQRSRAGRLEPGRLQMLVALMFAVMLPDVLMNKISELYVYQPNVFFAILFAAAMLGLYRSVLGRGRNVLLILLSLFMIVFMVSHSYSTVHKMARMRDNGLLAERLTNEIKTQMPDLPSRKVFAVNRRFGPAPLYSIYYMEGVYVLGGGKVFDYLYGEKLEEFRYYSFAELDQGLAEVPGKKVILLYDRGHIKVEIVDGAENPFTSKPKMPKQ